jgi:hypothetical protein
MIGGRSAVSGAGKTRVCPHCKATILESAAVCPQCRHHLKYGVAATAEQSRPKRTALRIEGTLRQPESAAVSEYSVVMSVRNERGEEVSRQIIGVGALRPGELRVFTLAVELAETESQR